MKLLVQLEELAMFLLGLFAFSRLPFAWWLFPALILAPDISFIGYAAGNITGAVMYNIFHHKAISILIFVAGILSNNQILQLVAVILFSHASMDRIFGYGLKTFQGFKFTHLGEIGK